MSKAFGGIRVVQQLAAAMFAVIFGAAAVGVVKAQEVPAIAVYVTGAASESTNRTLGRMILDALVDGGTYGAAGRSDELLKQLAVEQAKLPGSRIGDAQIKKLGKQFGADFVCVADVMSSAKTIHISAHIVNVKSGRAINVGRTSSKLEKPDDLPNAVAKLFGGSKGAGKQVQQVQQTQQTQETQQSLKQQSGPKNADWDIAALNTAGNAKYLSDLEKEVILELNMARSNPKKYAEMYINPNQGAFAKECYEELRKSKSLPLLLPKKGLSQAAKDHVADTGPKGITGHNGSNGSSMTDRINRHGKWGSGASENISYGHNAAREIVLQLLIDDGVETRGHRKNIMNGASKCVGVAVGTHAKYRYMCVQNFAVDYTDK